VNIIGLSRPEVNILFDYITITFPVDKSELNYRNDNSTELYSLFTNSHFKYFKSVLGLNEWQFSDYGKIEHYDRLIIYKEHIHFRFNGPENSKGENTHSLELKGEGCREAERSGIDWYHLLSYVHEHELTVSTLHIASDLFTEKYFNIKSLLKKALNHEYISFSRKFSHIQSKKNDVSTGTSLYFGRRDDNQINIYDKKNERYYKGFDVDTNVWIRIEIRLKSNKSWDFIRLFVTHGYIGLPKLYFKILSSMLEFKSKSASTDRKERWNTWRPWERYLGSVDKIRLVNQAKLESTLVKKREWLLDSAGKILLEYFSAINPEEKIDFFSEILKRKLEKIDYTSLARVNQYRLTNKLPTFETLESYKTYLQKDLIQKII